MVWSTRLPLRPRRILKPRHKLPLPIPTLMRRTGQGMLLAAQARRGRHRGNGFLPELNSATRTAGLAERASGARGGRARVRNTVANPGRAARPRFFAPRRHDRACAHESRRNNRSRKGSGTGFAAWFTDVNATQRGVDWQMQINDARTRLKSIYPTIKL